MERTEFRISNRKWNINGIRNSIRGKKFLEYDDFFFFFVVDDSQTIVGR